MPELSLDDPHANQDEEDDEEDEIIEMNEKPKDTAADACDDDDDDDDEEEEDEIIEMKVKSRETVIREKFNRAKASGNVHSIHDTATAAASSSSIRATFRSISSIVTSMRDHKSSDSAPCRERQVVLEDGRGKLSPMMKFEATWMELDNKHKGFVVSAHEKINGRLVKIAMHPFAQGGLRNVYRLKEIVKEPLLGEQKRPKALVAKESRHHVKYQDRLRFHVETLSCQAKASIYAKEFNRELRNKAHLLPSSMVTPQPVIRFLRADVYRLKDSTQPGGFRYLAVEPELEEGKYEKWNSNNGYVNGSSGESTIQFMVAQAFRYVLLVFCVYVCVEFVYHVVTSCCGAFVGGYVMSTTAFSFDKKGTDELICLFEMFSLISRGCLIFRHFALLCTNTHTQSFFVRT